MGLFNALFAFIVGLSFGIGFVEICFIIYRVIKSMVKWSLFHIGLKKSISTEYKVPETILFNVEREPIRLTFDNIEYFEVRDGKVVRDKFETDFVKFEKVPIIGSCGSYQYKKIQEK